MIHRQHEQGSPEWLAARRGCITGSRFKDCRDKLKSGAPSKACLAYARDIARERCGGMAPAKFQNAAMRIGTEQEAPAVRVYEVRTGNLTEEVGFFTTDDGLFGLSPDRLIDDDGVLEVKTMVSSDTLFAAVADGDVSEYMDQCLGYLWLLGRQWVDLVLWAPDLQHMTIKRITRDENAIEALEADLMAFARLVAENEAALRRALGQAAQPVPQAPAAPPTVETVVAAAAAPNVHPMPTRAPAAPAGPPTLKLGDIRDRLHPLQIDAAGLETLGFPPAGREGAAKLYHQGDLPRILTAAIGHLAMVRDQLAKAA